MSVSGVNTGAAQPLAAAWKAAEPSKAERTEEAAQRRFPLRDEYVPEKKPEPAGRYWKERDAGGRPKIRFDSPEQAGAAPKEPEKGTEDDAPAGENPIPAEDAKAPEKGGKKEERCAGNTDQVDREIKNLKRKRQELEQRLAAEPDEIRAKNLQRQLDRVERELRQKDNDAYRKAHSTFTRLS